MIEALTEGGFDIPRAGKAYPSRKTPTPVSAGD